MNGHLVSRHIDFSDFVVDDIRVDNTRLRWLPCSRL
jgi:hypothetical protein